MQHIDGSSNSGGAVQGGGAMIKDADTASFMADVIEKSVAVPVLVSFYSDWSEASKNLAPILEKIIYQAAGAIHMVRINFDQNKQLAEQVKIQSVPTVVVFVDQRPVDAFAGLKSQAEVKEFISQFAPEMQASPLEKMIEQADVLFSNKDYQEAGGLYSQISQVEPNNLFAIAGLAQCLIAMDDLDSARATLSSVPKQDEAHALILAAKAALDVADQISGLDDEGSLHQAIERDANNFQARFDLALISWAKGDQEAAAGHLLDIISQDRSWHDDGARKQLLKFFEIAGVMAPFTIKARKKLSSILFS